MLSFSTPSKPPVSSSVYIVPLQSPNMKTPTGKEQYASYPWRGSSSTEISTEKQHETFLAEFDEKFSMSAHKMATPPTKISGFGSPEVQYSPWKREVYLPPPITMEDSIAVFECLGSDPHGGGLKRKSGCNDSAYANKKCI
nr:hypothetical protein [Tanacetum cinerariifolium]